MFRILAVVIPIILLQGCAVAPPSIAERLDSRLTVKETALLLDKQAKQCWTKQVSPISAGIYVDSKVALDDSVVIKVSHVGWASGLNPKPFAMIQIKGSFEAPTIEVWEGEFACTIVAGCHKLELASHVKKWLAGDVQCFDFAKTLVHM